MDGSELQNPFLDTHPAHLNRSRIGEPLARSWRERPCRSDSLKRTVGIQPSLVPFGRVG